MIFRNDSAKILKFENLIFAENPEIPENPGIQPTNDFRAFRNTWPVTK